MEVVQTGGLTVRFKCIDIENDMGVFFRASLFFPLFSFYSLIIMTTLLLSIKTFECIFNGTKTIFTEDLNVTKNKMSLIWRRRFISSENCIIMFCPNGSFNILNLEPTTGPIFVILDMLFCINSCSFLSVFENTWIEVHEFAKSIEGKTFLITSDADGCTINVNHAWTMRIWIIFMHLFGVCNENSEQLTK